MSSVDIANRILDAIDTIVKDRVDNAGYDKTIRGVVSKLEDTITGKYLIKYQDGIIEAYSNNLNTNYPEGTLVDILVPNGDFSATKIILNTVNKNKVQYNTTVAESSTMESAGGNSIAATQEYGLCSYHTRDEICLYDRDNGVNLINYDRLSFEEHVKENDKILCGAKFRTDLDAGQTKDGNFGIVYEIEFKNNTTGNVYTRAYTVDVNKMKGNPYSHSGYIKQTAIFKGSNENFVGVSKIYIFSEKFSSIDITKERKDIFVKDFELSSMRDLTSEELNGYSVALVKEGKGYFDENSTDKDKVKVQSTLKLKGNAINTPADYYWFINNNQITEESKEYIRYGGIGWECINSFNKVDNGKNIWITDKDYYDVSKNICYNMATKIKCVVVKDDSKIAEREITIYNYNPDHSVTIISDQGIYFYFDNGNPTLTCLVDREEVSNYSYYWTCEDINGDISILEETRNENNEYNAANNEYNTLLAQIAGGTAGAAASEERLAELKEIIDNYNYTQRVEGNKIIHVDLSKINEQATFRCTVKNGETMIGSSDITIYNTLGIEGEYKLNILNGNQVFSYDYNGISPASKALEKPIKINPLAFEIIDSQGRKFDKAILETCDIEWQVPQENTMITAEGGNGLYLDYSISEKFDYKKTNNDIKLIVKYKNLYLETQTSFTFIKDGDPGTNATGVICKIVPNTDEDFNEYVTITNGELNFTPAETNKWFKVQLWENGERTFNDYKSDAIHTITWSILTNKYNRGDTIENTITEPTTIAVTGSNFSYLGYDADAASIVKVQVDYNNNTYYCTYPVIIVEAETDYKIKLKQNSGFRFVTYTSNGTQPQYDNTTPFTIQTSQLINSYWEDITNDDYKELSYEWNVKGSLLDNRYEDFPIIANINLKIDENAELAENQKFLIPNESYTGECINNGIEIKIFNSELNQIGKIYIPIHMYLDRYSNSAINGWDGNKVAIDQLGGTILSPQVGAGKKEADNTFTGVVIGSSKERGSNSTEQGLFGFSGGQRSIFLDAKTGNATFGVKGRGQIKLDAQNGGKITGGNYIEDPQEEGMPREGMEIDLSDPHIKWGNGNFEVDKNGNLTCKNATINGDIISDKGVLTNLVYTGVGFTPMFAGMQGFSPLGFSSGWGGNPDKMYIDFDIPDGFTVKSAYVYIDHAPTQWVDQAGDIHNPCYSRKIKLYTATNMDNQKWYWFQTMAIQYQEGLGYIEIPNAFTADGFTGEPNRATSAKTEFDIQDYLLSGRNSLVLYSAEELDDNEDGLLHTGSICARLEIIGWMKTSNN